MENKPFDNEARRRYYGLRIGDRVSCRNSSTLKQFQGEGYVVAYGGTDNNAVYVQVPSHKKPIRCVAEWLTLEERIDQMELIPGIVINRILKRMGIGQERRIKFFSDAFEGVCTHCGIVADNCQCWNDE